MKKTLLLAAMALALGGCQTKTVEEMSYSERKALAQEINQRCYDQGIKPESAELRQCAQVEAQREIYKRQTAPRWHFNPAGAAGALQGVSQGYYRASAATVARNRTVTCSSVPSPAGMAKVRCY